jgi:ferric-dicitrate binding protein FerR (iron transport regulator)
LHSLNSQRPVVEPVAQVARVIGTVRIRPVDSRDWTSLHEDEGLLPSDTVLRTEAASAAALQFDEVSVRIAGGAEVMLESRSRLRLISGRIYVDTNSVGAAGRMLVVTDVGSVSDVGTQFEVQYREGEYRVRVREGEVLLQHGSQRERGVAGEQISIDRAGTVGIVAFPDDDPAWHWVQVLASAPDIDDQPLTVLLAWVARETGLAIRYATPAIERRANTTILHGSVRHLEPLQALAIMMATTDLRHEVLSDGTIMIK